MDDDASNLNYLNDVRDAQMFQTITETSPYKSNPRFAPNI